MPQITIEYSSNLELGSKEAMLLAIHEILAHNLPTELESCKTRIIKYDDYLIGDGKHNSAFLHAEIRIMGGRSEDVVNHTNRLVLEHLQKHLTSCGSQCKWQVTVGVSNLPHSYIKHSKS